MSEDNRISCVSLGRAEQMRENARMSQIVENLATGALAYRIDRAQKAERSGLEMAALLVEEGQECVTCGATFLGSEDHPSPYCRRPNWSSLQGRALAQAIRALSDPA